MKMLLSCLILVSLTACTSVTNQDFKDKSKPMVEEGFFLTKTTWPDYKDTVPADLYEDQSAFDRSHLGPVNKTSQVVIAVKVPNYLNYKD